MSIPVALAPVSWQRMAEGIENVKKRLDRAAAAMNGDASMDRFRLFHSRAFWFGVPGLVGLLWGWWASMGSISTLAVGHTRNCWTAQSAGEVLISWNSGGLPDDLDFLGEDFSAFVSGRQASPGKR